MSNTMNFDESFYLSQNPDVAAAVSRGIFTSGAQHYQLNGRFEGRNPNAFFNTSFYLGTYTDVARAGVNPLTHFLTSGAAEGRFANATEKGAIDLNNNGGADDFNNAKYLTDYPDVAAAVTAGTFKSAYQHFVQFGQFEGRVGTLSNGTTITGPFTNTGVPVDAGQTLTLTTAPDTLTGGNLNDTFNGVVGDTVGTLTSADVINGGAGNDTLNARIVATTTGAVAPVVSNVENIVVSSILTTGTGTISLAGSTGYTNLTIRDTTLGGTTAITGIASGTALALNNADGTTTLNILGAASRTGTADALNLSVSNGTGATGTANFAQLNLVDGANAADATFEVLNVSTSGAASFVNLANGGANVNTLKVTGTGSLTMTETGNFANLKTIDASGLTSGGLSVNTTLAQDVSFTGSAGDDRLAVTGTLANVTANDKFAFGGGTDTLAFTTVTDFSATPAAAIASINAATGLERIELAAQDVTALKANDFTVNSFVISGGNAANTSTALALTGVETSDSFLFSNSRSGTVTFTGASVAQTANVAFDGSDTLSGVSAAALSGNAGTAAIAFNGNITSLTVNSTGTTANFITGGAGGSGAAGLANALGQNGGNGGSAIDNGTAVQTVSITGSQNLTIAGGAAGAAGAQGAGTGPGTVGNAGLGFSGAVSIDASTFTGKLNVVASSGADVIKVGVATTGDASLTGNIIRGAGGADTITLNTGVDKLDYRVAADSLSAAFDTVNGFAAGQDKFVVSTAVSALKAVSAAGTGTLATDIATAFNGTNFGGNSNAAVVTITGNTDAGTYLVVDSSANNAFDAGSDLVVKLVGLSGTLSITDFATTTA